MSDDDVRSYSLKYPRNEKGIWLDLCREHLCGRLAIPGVSMLDKRTPVTASACADCDPKGALR